MHSDPNSARPPLRSTLEGDPDMAELVGLFVGDLPQRINSIEQAWSTKRAADIQRLAHQLRGSSASYGFPTIGESAARLEDSILALGSTPTDSLDTLRRSVDELIQLCKQAATR